LKNGALGAFKKGIDISYSSDIAEEGIVENNITTTKKIK
jgi:hypothetical protein